MTPTTVISIRVNARRGLTLPTVPVRTVGAISRCVLVVNRTAHGRQRVTAHRDSYMTSEREFKQNLLTSRWCSSWIGRARPCDRYDQDGARRAAAWGNWAVGSLTEVTGAQDRVYPALTLEGKFHDPKGTGPLVRPHLEIPLRLLAAQDETFPDRLGQLGNAAAFPWWVVQEVTALKRALFNTPGGDVSAVIEALNSRRGALVDVVEDLSRQAAPHWRVVEEMLVGDPDGLAGVAAADFSAEEVAEFFPAGRDLVLSVRFDDKLRDGSKSWVSRRLGVWQLLGTDSQGVRFALGVATPRLTANSQFNDKHFSPEKESPAALLVRGLIMRRLLERVIGQNTVMTTIVEPEVAGPTTYLRAVLAQVGQKMPEASIRSAVQFLQTNPDPDVAWHVLEEWALRTGTILTVREEQFRESHRRALRFVRRAEEPDRDDVNVLLPLGWDERSRVVRVTFSTKSE